MEIDEVEIVQAELKYCERCGALWVRLCGDDQVYCASCRPLISQFPLRKLLGWGLSSDAESGHGGELLAVSTGGNA